jgi:hypothetical protein
MARRTLAPLLLAMCASFLLAGCFTSSQPKLSLSTAVPALGDGGRYVGYSRKGDGSFQRDEVFTMRRRADGGYDYVDEKGKVTPVSLHRIGSDLYVAQAIRENGHDADYVALSVRDGETLSYPLDCSKQDTSKLKALGVELRDDGKVCAIDNVADPLTLFTSAALGEPSGKMVRE